MRFAWFALAALLFSILTVAGNATGNATGRDTPVGIWLTQGSDAVIAIEPCDGGLCGRIVGVSLDHPDDPVPVGWKGRSQCGETIIRDAMRDGDAGWAGEIIDPRDGRAYRARMQLDEQHRLRVRGYIGIALFGRTQVWTPFTGNVPEDCRLVLR